MSEDSHYSANEVVLLYLQEKGYTRNNAQCMLQRCRKRFRVYPEFAHFLRGETAAQQWNLPLVNPTEFKDCLETVLNSFFRKREKKEGREELEGFVSFGLKIAEEIGIFVADREIKTYLNMLVNDCELASYLIKKLNRWLVKDSKKCCEYLREKLISKFSSQTYALCRDSNETLYTRKDIRTIGCWSEETYEEILQNKNLLKLLGDPVVQKKNGQLVYGYPASVVTHFIEMAKREYNETDAAEVLTCSLESVLGSSLMVTIERMKRFEQQPKEPFED